MSFIKGYIELKLFFIAKSRSSLAFTFIPTVPGIKLILIFLEVNPLKEYKL